LKAKELVDFVIKAKNEGWGYFYGGQGQVYTQEWADQLILTGKSTKDYCYRRAAKWFGKKVVDCSGLIIEAFRSIGAYGDKTANTLFLISPESGKFNSLPANPYGCAVFREGIKNGQKAKVHVGICIGNGQVIEARGVDYGVVQTDITKRGWTHWSKLRDVDYSEVPLPQPVAFTLSRQLKRTLPVNMSGLDVAAVQTALLTKGFDPQGIDGKFGQHTKNAVIAFQKAYSLKVDGIVGPQTCTALGGIWKG
jgi:hypothetical protein